MTETVIERWKQKIRNMKKEDYIVLVLIGVLLLIISLPTEKKRAKEGEAASPPQRENGQEGGSIADFLGGKERDEGGDATGAAAETGNLNDNTSYYLNAYVAGLEKRVEEIISGMEGAGKVRVMIAVSDMGTEIVERNLETTISDLEETDNAGGSRKSKESEERKEVIYRRDSGGNEVPYVVRRMLPEVTGVVVSAEGAGNTKVKENIIGAVSVLFDLNEHRIKVIRMKS